MPSQRRTTIRSGDASVEMIEHVMAALAGLQVDNAVVEIDAGECPGCDGSSRAFVEAIDAAGIVEQDRMRPALVVEEPMSIREGDAVLAIHPPGPRGGLTLSYHLDYGRGAAIPAQSYCVGLSADSFREELSASRTFLLEAEAAALRAAGIGVRTTEADLLLFGRDGVIGNELRFPDECAAQGPRHGRRPRASGHRPARLRRRLSLGPPDQRRPGPPAARGRRAAGGTAAPSRCRSARTARSTSPAS